MITSNDIGGRIIWQRAEVKAMFQLYGLWPTFIGVVVDPFKEAKGGLMPVILSQEQNRLVDRVNYTKIKQNLSLCTCFDLLLYLWLSCYKYS
jgi:hypothetical protein